MGSIGLHREPGQSDRAFFEGELPQTLTERGEIIACASTNGVFYAAVRDRTDGVTWALVIKMNRYRGWENFIYKPMDETVMPYYFDAPAKVLDVLTPTDNEHANEWRQQCRTRLAKRAEVRGIKTGTRLRFARPLTFTNGETADTFTLRRERTARGGSRTTFISDAGTRLRIQRWQDMAFEVVA